ncbi:Uncharacterised protein g901 [Pycnogonum litorale]
MDYSNLQRTTIRLTMLLSVAMVMVSIYANCAPHTTGEEETNLNDLSSTANMGDECIPGTEIRDTCEMCAKLTNSKDAYRKCCRNINGVRKYCHNYLNYQVSGIIRP